MISNLLHAFKKGFDYFKFHTHLLFVVLLLVFIPLIFLYTGQQFLDAGRANQDRLQKDKIAILHDVFASLVTSSNFDREIIQDEIDRIASLNFDINDFRVVSIENGVVSPIAALDREKIGTIEPYVDMFINATANLDQPLIQEINTDAGRIWLTYRAIRKDDGTFYVIHTVTSLETIDALFEQREQQALFSLIYIFIFILILTYWHIRMTDYQHLYNKELENNATKDTFINMMAHELRAPLTAIKGYSELLRDAITDAVLLQHVQRITQSSERLIEMISDLLDVSRIQSGSLSIDFERSDVSGVVQAVLQELEITAQEKNITLHSVGADTPHEAEIDVVRLHQVLTNLVNNSIKYTEAGTIEIQVTPHRRDVEIRIKDTGMGINAEDQKKLFAPFFRVRTADVSAITGSGLGMWITKQLVTMMGGTIGVESIRGVGTHIVLTFKTTRPKTVAKQAS